MKINSFEEIISWQKAKELTLNIYKSFEKCRDKAFCDQIQRAVVSIMNNIAEGFERETNNELIRFLYIAKGSCGETRSMILLAYDLKYLLQKERDDYLKLTEDISKLLYGLIKSVKQ